MALIKTNARSASQLDATILTGNLPALNGSAITTINASNISSGTLNSARYSGGKVLQVVQTIGTYVTDTSSTSPSTNITVTIVPSATSSKILVIYAPPTTNYLSNQTNYGQICLNREVSGGSDDNITSSGHNSSWGLYAVKGSSNTMKSGSAINVLDSPSTTSSIDYKIRVWVDNASLNMIWGHSSGQACMSSLTAMEIGA
tara:strand:+ start:885 stop:1487 length:603 start_codon:yes stop_codon:yes gene_type:complete